MLASQRIESVMDFSGESSYDDDLPTKRGAAPTLIELFILSWVSGKASSVVIRFDVCRGQICVPAGEFHCSASTFSHCEESGNY